MNDNPLLESWWVNENTGQVSCAEHGGGYLNAAVRGLPTLTEHITPLGTWIQITPDYQAEFLKQVDASSMGELCQDGTRKDEHR